MATGCADRYNGRGIRWPIWKHRDTGALVGSYVLMSDYATAGSLDTDPGAGTKTANAAGILDALAAAQAAGHNTILVDGIFWTNAAPTLLPGPVTLIGRNRQIDPTFTAADGIVGDDDTSGSPVCGILFASAVSSPWTNIGKCQVYGLLLQINGATVRGGHGYGPSNLSFIKANEIVAQDVQLRGAPGTGVFTLRSDGALFRKCTVVGVYADAYLITSTDNVMVEFCEADGCGDDFFSYVNVAADVERYNCTFRYNTGRNQTLSGGGIKVDGGNNVVFHNNFCRNYYGRAIGITSSTAADGHKINDVLVQNNTFDTNSNTSNAPAIHIAGRSTTYTANNVIVDGNVCTNQVSGHLLINSSGSSGNFSDNVTISDHVSIAADIPTGIAGLQVYGVSNLTLSNNQYVGLSNAAHCFSSDKSSGPSTVAGTWIIDGVTFDTFNTPATAALWVFKIWDIASGSVEISDCHLLSTYGTSESQWFLNTNYQVAGNHFEQSSCTSTDNAGTNYSATNWTVD